MASNICEAVDTIKEKIKNKDYVDIIEILNKIEGAAIATQKFAQTKSEKDLMEVVIALTRINSFLTKELMNCDKKE